MSSEALALSVQDVSKTYKIATGSARQTLLSDTVRDWMRHPFNRRRDRFEALRHVSLDVATGEAVGIIGANGAGKSTLLKILSRIVSPTSGRVELFGRPGSLLEVGTGFHPELTGRENIYLNGSILGMRQRDISREFESIVAFADVERFLDTPVKRYSSGMYVRLAFAVAAHLNPDILLVDEVLAVGDAEFQRKCLGKMGEVATQEGRTVLFVSHNMAAIESFCERSIHFDHGEITFDGPTRSAIDHYLSAGVGQNESAGVFDLTTAPRAQGEERIFRRLEVRRADGVLTDSVRMGEGVTLAIDVEGLALRTAGVVVRILTESDFPIVTIGTGIRPLEYYNDSATPDRVVLTIPHVPLVPGNYFIELLVQEGGTAKRKVVRDHLARAASIEVIVADVYGSGFRFGPQIRGVIYMDGHWQAEQDGLVVAASASVTGPRRQQVV
jgi:lipopolysaccharide transport system ATP-binding protein